MFFYLIGGIIFVIFLASDFAKQADFDYLFTSLILFGIGWYLRISIKPPPSANRFSYVKNFREIQRKKKEERQQKAADKKKKK